MGRVSEKNKRYRTKEMLIADLKKVLELDVYYGTKFAVIHEITWIWTEFYGKYVGNPYWSEEALKVYEDRQNIDNFSYGKLLRHDHSVPRRIIIEHFLHLENVSEDYIKNVFDRVLVGTILTKQENDIILKDTMPPLIENKTIDKYGDTDKWIRYKEKGIKIFEVEWQKKKIIYSKEIIY